jgi:hypothetical protein
MGVNIGLDPVGLLDTAFDISGNRARADRQWAASETQRTIDNQWRTKMFVDYNTKYHQALQREDNRLQRLVKDAKAAGLGPRAALGLSGYAPPNIAVPGQAGGRVGGVTRTKLPSMTVSMTPGQAYDDTVRFHQARLLQFQADKAYYDMATARDEYNGVLNEEVMPGVWMRARDNREEAMRWYEEGYFPYVRPELNLETPESVGGYYFAVPRIGNEESGGLLQFLKKGFAGERHWR